jgi:hypothetical protein
MIKGLAISVFWVEDFHPEHPANVTTYLPYYTAEHPRRL